MSKNLIFAIHGFLGQASDWDQVRLAIPESEWITIDLFSTSASDVTSFENYVDHLIEKYVTSTETSKAKKIFVGYSLGGRLGLYILSRHANKFDHFVFVSAHPGLNQAEEKTMRLDSDQKWSEAILNLEWDQFLLKWNQQPIFGSAEKDPIRLRSDYDPKKLALAMQLWSLGNQKDMRPTIQKYQNKITWVVGDQDSKFIGLAEDLKQKKILLGYNKISSGHRILISNPNDLAGLLQNLF